MNKSARIAAARSAWVVGLLLLGLVAPTTAQFPPDSFTNLQVLPQNIEWPTLQRLMRSFNSALGTGVCIVTLASGANRNPLGTSRRTKNQPSVEHGR